ncbi:MAG: hypothetical protein K9K67_13250 [Bacteriovoracaceae bacterium]|nr:hypothetical protein [Bacteriovoracaceae bacterium]
MNKNLEVLLKLFEPSGLKRKLLFVSTDLHSDLLEAFSMAKVDYVDIQSDIPEEEVMREINSYVRSIAFIRVAREWTPEVGAIILPSIFLKYNKVLNLVGELILGETIPIVFLGIEEDLQIVINSLNSNFLGAALDKSVVGLDQVLMKSLKSE